MITLGFSGIANGQKYRDDYALRFVGHDSGIALLKDGETVFAAEQERFSRKKHTSEFPVEAFAVALSHGSIRPDQIESLAYPWKVTLPKFLNMALNHGFQVPLQHAPSLLGIGLRVIRDQMSPGRIGDQFSDALGIKLPPCTGVPHHLSHAACSFFSSPFTDAAMLTLDGQGEDESGTLGAWRNNEYVPLASIRSPNSIGILYGMMTDFLGMRAAWDEYKVMGMAAYGDASRFRSDLEKLVTLLPDGSYRTKNTAMVFKPAFVNHLLSVTFGIAPRSHGEELQQVHFDLAAAIQEVTEKVVLQQVCRLRRMVPENNLCLGGGVFQNSVINGKILRSGLFDRVHVPPAPGDHGAALGAAMYVQSLDGVSFHNRERFNAFLGPDFSNEEIERVIASRGERVHVTRPEYLDQHVARLLAQDNVVAWFQGRMEYGPRALGKRSILANPCNLEMKEVVNAKVKHREPFRPFAGAVPAELQSEYFELADYSPYMQFVVPIRAAYATQLPSINHHGTCRAQSVSKADDPLFHSLLTEFGKLSGIPILLNTSFNNNDEPIVCSPLDAISSFERMEIDALILGPYVVSRVV